VPWEVCIDPFVIVSSSRFNLCNHLREESVDRDPTLYELLTEDVTFFVNPNLKIKYFISACHLSFTCCVVAIFTHLLSLSCSRSLLHS
jgi:hypothetical protein